MGTERTLNDSRTLNLFLKISHCFSICFVIDFELFLYLLALVESLARGVSFVQLVFGLSNPRQSANFPLVKPKIRARIGQNVCPIRGEFAAGERFHQGQK